MKKNSKSGKRLLSVLLCVTFVLSGIKVPWKQVQAAVAADLKDSKTNVTLSDTDDELTQNITMNAKVFEENGSLVSNTGRLKVWTPIGTNSYSFKGKFDGDNKTIRAAILAAGNEVTITGHAAGVRNFYVEVKDETGKVVRSNVVPAKW